MQERFITIQEVAYLMSTSKSKALKILAQYGIEAVDFGWGRGGGRRWLLSSITAVLQTMAKEAQEKRREPRKVSNKPATAQLRLLSMSVDEIYKLTSNPRVQ